MIKPSINLQELRRRIYRKAKAERQWRFWGLYVHVCKMETLRAAYQRAKTNDGTPGIDGESFQTIETKGVEKFLEGIRQELLERSYQSTKNRRVEIPKGNGKTRKLGIPTIKDRVVQGAVKLILEAIFEADFYISSPMGSNLGLCYSIFVLEDRNLEQWCQALTFLVLCEVRKFFSWKPRVH